MDNRSGVWHKTTIQAAQESCYGAVHNASSLSGRKRQHEELTLDSDETGRYPTRSLRFQHQVTGPNEKPRIKPSLVVDLDPILEKGPSEYSQRKEISATPTSSVDPLLSLAHPRYKLPQSLVRNMMEMGIKQIYPWQKQCLLGPGLLTGEKNLVYSAPTGGGKSLVADIIMLKKAIDNPDTKALLVLPFVALVQEKVRWLRNLVRGICRKWDDPHGTDTRQKNFWRRRADQDTVRVVGFFGGSIIKAGWNDFDIGVCTIEKVGVSGILCPVYLVIGTNSGSGFFRLMDSSTWPLRTVAYLTSIQLFLTKFTW